MLFEFHIFVDEAHEWRLMQTPNQKLLFHVSFYLSSADFVCICKKRLTLCALLAVLLGDEVLCLNTELKYLLD
jgi:hypothetical protein